MFNKKQKIGPVGIYKADFRDSVGFAPGWSRIPCPATGNLTSGDGESWRRHVPAWLFRLPRLYGNGIPGCVSIKKARCLLTAGFLLVRDSVGIRTQDPQLRRLLLYPAELPNHPDVSSLELPLREERTANIGIFCLMAIFFDESFEILLSMPGRADRKNPAKHPLL